MKTQNDKKLWQRLVQISSTLFCCFLLSFTIVETSYAQGSTTAMINLLRSQGVTATEVRQRMAQYNITAEDLKNAGYTTSDLKDAGFNAQELRDAGITVAELQAAGFTTNDLKSAGFTANDLRNAGFSVQDLISAGFTAQDLKSAGFSISDLRTAGMTLTELKTAGFSATDLKNAGATERELLSAGFTVAQLKAAGSDAQALKTAGATPAQLKAAGFTNTQLKSAGFSASELNSAGTSFSELKQLGYSAQELKGAGASARDLRLLGYTTVQLKNAGYSAAQLRDAGVGLAELKSSGLTATELIQAGFSAAELKAEGYTITELKNAGASLNDLKVMGATAAELKDAGFSATELKSTGLTATELKSAGFTTAQLIEANYSISEMKTAGVAASELKAAGMNAALLQNAGFTAEELLAAGFAQSDLIESGQTIQERIAGGANPKELFDSGEATLADLLNAGVSVTELRSLGFSDNQLIAADVTVGQLLTAGATPKQLLESGASLNNLRNSGVSTQDLINAGADPKALIQAGVGVPELKTAGVSTKELVEAGASSSSLLAAGIEVRELVSAGVSTKDLLSAGATPRALLSAGTTVSDLKQNGVSTTDLISSGANVRDMVSAGVPATELISAGVPLDALINSGASTSELKTAGVSAEELKNNGATTIDLVAAGYSVNELTQAGLNANELFIAGMSADDLVKSGVPAKTLLEAGATVRDLRDAGVSADVLVGAGATENQLRQAGFSEEEIEVAVTTPVDPVDPVDPTDPKPNIDDLIRSELIGKILNDGEACRAASSGSSDANTCRTQGRIWNCDMNVCYTQAYRDDVVTRSLQCYENDTRPERQNACVDGIKNQTVRDIASGSLCETTTPEAIACAGAGKIYNCNIKQCLTASQNLNLTTQVEACYKTSDVEARNACMKQTEVNVAVDLMSNCEAQSSPAAVACRRDPQRSFNCMANTCLDKTYNDSIVDGTKECMKVTGADRDNCLNDLKIDVVKHIASGASCDKTIPAAKECSEKGNIYNCNVGYCLTEDQNNELVDKTVQCEVQSNNSAEKEQCLYDLKKDAVARVASGELCDKGTPEAMSCSAQGKVFNCNVNTCLTIEENLLLTDRIVSCEMDTADLVAKDACYKTMREEVIKHVASGKNCVNTSEESLACEAEGKIWNCNVNFCLTEEQNNVLSDEIVTCQVKESKLEIDNCMAALEDKAIDYLMRSCDVSENPEAKACQERGRVWNCQVKMCLSETDHQRLVTAVKNCNAMPTKEEQEACHAELKEFETMAEDGKGLDSSKVKMPSNPSKIVHGGAAALGLASGAMGCYSGYAISAAGALAVVNEMNTDKTAESSMKSLQERVKAMEERVKKEDASFELQVEVFDFSLQAIDEGIRIAEQKDSGYGMVLGMYGVALGITAIELAMWWDPSKMVCGAMNVGTSVAGMATVGMIKGAINKGIADLQAQRARIQTIKDRFLHHFGGHGALASERNRKGEGGGDYEAGEQALATLGSSAQKPRNRAQSQDLTVIPSSAETARSCIDGQSKPDSACDCAKTNSCLQVEDLMGNAKSTMRDSNLNQMVSGLPSESILNDTNQILKGQLSAGELGRSAINTRNERVIEVTDKLMKPINENLAKQGEPTIGPVDEAGVMAFIDKFAKPQDISAMANRNADRLNVDDLIQDGKLEGIEEDIKTLATSDLKPGAGILPNFNFDAFKFDDLGDVKLKNEVTGDTDESENMVLSKLEKDASPYEYNSTSVDVHKDPNMNLFNIISNRYNILRFNNRLGGLE